MTVPLVKQAHNKLSGYIKDGDVVVDATMGNGFDTLFLAQVVGKHGKVYAFDVQAKAIDSTKARINEAGVSERVRLIHASHADLADHLQSDNIESIRCAMFNLGYLPGTDKANKTKPQSTIQALNATLGLLGDSGVISVLAYTGHQGGKEEAEKVKDWAASLSRSQFYVAVEIPASLNTSPPEWIFIERR